MEGPGHSPVNVAELGTKYLQWRGQVHPSVNVAKSIIGRKFKNMCNKVWTKRNNIDKINYCIAYNYNITGPLEETMMTEWKKESYLQQNKAYSGHKKIKLEGHA